MNHGMCQPTPSRWKLIEGREAPSVCMRTASWAIGVALGVAHRLLNWPDMSVNTYQIMAPCTVPSGSIIVTTLVFLVQRTLFALMLLLLLFLRVLCVYAHAKGVDAHHSASANSHRSPCPNGLIQCSRRVEEGRSKTNHQHLIPPLCWTSIDLLPRPTTTQNPPRAIS